MSEWGKVILEDAIEQFLDYRGKTPPKTEEGVPLITAKIVKNGTIQTPNEFISKKTYETWMNRGYPKVNDVVLTVEAPLGEVALLKDDYAVPGQRIIMMRGKADIIDNAFLKYYFQSRNGQHALLSRSSGTTVFGIKAAVLRKIPIPTPPLSEQKAIAAVLSSLDDKIALLQRQNVTLEAMAQTFFQQWFVEFQFSDQSDQPYYKNNGEMIETEIGELPVGWEIVSLEDITHRITDGSHHSPPSTDFGFPMASVKNMRQWGFNEETCRRISEEDYDKLVQNDCRPLKNDVLIAKDGSYLKHVFVVPKNLDMVVLSSIAILRPNERYNSLLLTSFLKLASTKQKLENIVTGAVIPRIVLKDFRKFKLPLPPKQIQNMALEIIEPIYNKCWANIEQIHTLEILRDSLLPKLMSGEVRVAYE
jgi:type I restriction enzyme, S subunit